MSLLLGTTRPGQVLVDGPTERLGQTRRDGVPDLTPLLLNLAGQVPVVRERLQALDLLDAENPIAPVERSHVVGPPGLDRPRRHVGAQLQEERPVPLPPLE